jgi:hypothetical protein
MVYSECQGNSACGCSLHEQFMRATTLILAKTKFNLPGICDTTSCNNRHCGLDAQLLTQLLYMVHKLRYEGEQGSWACPMTSRLTALQQCYRQMLRFIQIMARGNVANVVD